ncbi:MAG: mercury resistance system periplasmic binding protein MerP [Pseudomonadota bacterium]
MRPILAVLTTLLLLSAVPLTAPAADATGLKTVTLKVENMSCSACPITVRKALEKVPGVAKAKADFETRTATVTFDPAKTNVEALTRATTEAGYPSALAR